MIREKLRDLLSGKTDAGLNVFSNTASAAWSEQLPLIAIYSRSEEIELWAVSPREYKRRLQIMIEVIASGSEFPNEKDGEGKDEPSAEDTLDKICEQIESAIAPDETLGEIEDPATKKPICLVDEMILSNIELTFRGEGDKPMCAAIMNFVATYHTYSPGSLDDQDGIGEFKKANVQWPIGTVVPPHEQQENFEVEDDLTIPN